MQYLGEPKKFKEWLGSIGQFPGDGGLVIKQTENLIADDTLAWPIIISGRDMTDEEFDQMDGWFSEQGYSEFLDENQLQDIKDNLSEQRPKYSQEELLYAINFYWLRDAFVCL